MEFISITLEGAYIHGGRGGGGVWSNVLFLYFFGLQIDGAITEGGLLATGKGRVSRYYACTNR